MRTSLLVLVSPLVVACAPQGDFAYRSTLTVPTRGIALHADGETGHAGMFGTNCPFETRRGSVTGDYMLPGSEEMVQDTGSTWLGDETVLLALGEDVWLLDKTDGVYDVSSFYVEGLAEGRIVDGGVASLATRGGCEVQWTLDEATSVVPVGDCGAAFDADWSTGRVAVSGGDTITLLDADGIVGEASTEGDALAFDPLTDALYVATKGERALNALEYDGSPRWELTVDSPVQAISAAGGHGAVAAILAHADGSGELLYVDGWTGAVLATVFTPQPADAITVSADGGTVALTTPRAVHFYRVAPGLF